VIAAYPGSMEAVWILLLAAGWFVLMRYAGG
jgi:hypothetical protein